MRWQRPMNATTVQAADETLSERLDKEHALSEQAQKDYAAFRLETAKLYLEHARHTSLTEHYASATVQIPGGTIDLGLSRSPGDPITAARGAARRICEEQALVLNGDDVSDLTAGPLSDSIAEQFAKAWPDRAWWLEIWQAEERLTQVYHRWPWPGDAR